MKETFWSKLRELWAIRRAANRSSLNNDRIGFRDQMNFMAERNDLRKLYC
jgi:hypothetical protein